MQQKKLRTHSLTRTVITMWQTIEEKQREKLRVCARDHFHMPVMPDTQSQHTNKHANRLSVTHWPKASEKILYVYTYCAFLQRVLVAESYLKVQSKWNNQFIATQFSRQICKIN